MFELSGRQPGPSLSLAEIDQRNLSQVIEDYLRIVYTVEHASRNFGRYSRRIALTEEQRRRFHDYGTLSTVPLNGFLVAAKYSRGIVDLNRGPDDPKRFPSMDFGKPTPNLIWKSGQELSQRERDYIDATIHKPYHDQILEIVRNFEAPGLVVSWHNTAHYEIGTDDSGKKQIMQPVILSNKGHENSPDGENTSCDPELLSAIADYLRKNLNKAGLPDDVLFNFIMKGGYSAEHYNDRRYPKLVSAPLQSFQVEYDTLLTHDQKTMKPNRIAIRSLRSAFQDAIEQAYRECLS